MVKQQLKNIFKSLCSVTAPSGRETLMFSAVEKIVRDMGYEPQYDNFGSMYVHAGGKGEKMLISAHVDEIGLIVRSISRDGFIRVAKMGGVQEKIMQARKVVSDNGVVGIIGVKPGHLQTEADKTRITTAKDCYIDVGARSKEEVIKMGIDIGTPFAFDGEYTEMYNSDLICAKASDDRIGCAVLLQLLQDIKGKELNYDLYVGFTVQEETGCKGALAIGNFLSPDISIAVDTIPCGDTPDVDAEKDLPIYLGAGAVMQMAEGISPANFMHAKVRKLLSEAAEKGSVPLQKVIMLGFSYGTEAKELSHAGTGSAAGTVCIPRRYSHSPVELFDINDAVSLLNLLKTAVEK